MLEKVIIFLTTLGMGINIVRLFLDVSPTEQPEKMRMKILRDKIMMYIGIGFTMIGVFMYGIGNVHFSSFEIGIILLLLGFGYIIAGILLSPTKVRLKKDWTSKQYKFRIITSGIIMMLIGFFLLIF